MTCQDAVKTDYYHYREYMLKPRLMFAVTDWIVSHSPLVLLVSSLSSPYSIYTLLSFAKWCSLNGPGQIIPVAL